MYGCRIADCSHGNASVWRKGCLHHVNDNADSGIGGNRFAASQWTSIDWLLVGITLFNICSCLYSVTPLPAYNAANISVLMFVAYWLQRSIFIDHKYTQAIITGYVMTSFVAMTLAVTAFVIYRQAVINAGFSETYSFRFLYRPFGYVNNMWAEIAVCMLGMACMMKRWRLPLMCLAAIVVLLTFSRGAYLSAALLLVLVTLTTKKRKRLAETMITVTVAIAVVAVVCKGDLVTTIHLNDNVTQRNSTEWRKVKTQASVNIFRSRPLLGYGNGSYTLITDGKAKSEDQDTFTDMAPNLPVKLLLENGIMGTLPYILLFICIVQGTWRCRRDTQTCVAGCTLTALAAKEMTQATLLQTPVMMFLAYSIMAYMQRSGRKYTEKNICGMRTTTITVTVLLVVWMAVFGGINGTHYLYNKETGHLNNGIKAVEQYRASHDAKYLKTATEELAVAFRQHPYDGRIGCMLANAQMQNRQYAQAWCTMDILLKDNPDYGLYQFTAACVLYEQHLKHKATDMMAKAICNMPQLLHVKELREIEKKDSAFYAALRKEIIAAARYSDTSISPIRKAKHGYILHHYGYLKEAKVLLVEAVTAMPSLRAPWRLLGNKKKYGFLSEGAFRMGTHTGQNGNAKNTDLISILYNSYSPRYQTWYLSDLPL